jgi:hypothetical protein
MADCQLFSIAIRDLVLCVPSFHVLDAVDPVSRCRLLNLIDPPSVNYSLDHDLRYCRILYPKRWCKPATENTQDASQSDLVQSPYNRSLRGEAVQRCCLVTTTVS